MQLRPHQLEALDKMNTKRLGQVIVPTGGGKTMCMIEDAKKRFTQSSLPQTIVVVAPRILLANQLSSEFLEFITDVDVIHVHSGETHHNSTTKADQLEYWVNNSTENILIFTTYHSLHRVEETGIEVDTIYFDEAHNSVQKNFYPATEHFSRNADRCYFFTATPKHSRTTEKAGMNHTRTYGNVICQIPAPRLVKQGYILPPKVEVYRSRTVSYTHLTLPTKRIV